MIALRDSLPLILLADGRTIGFQKDWLIRLLGVAADQAECQKWWLAEHVAHSIEVWLQNFRDQNYISAERFVSAVRDALTALGYPKIGRQFERTAPFHRISLLDVAREAGLGFELGFFVRLERCLQQVIQTGSTYCELHDLEHCVSFICNRKSSSRQCEYLASEIVSFARSAAHLRVAPNSDSSPIFLYVA